MKNQNEPGFTMVPNKLVDAIITYQCTGIKLEILMFMIRNTFGYHRESVTTTAVYIAEQICRNRIKTSVALSELIQNHVIIEAKGERGLRRRSLSINMNTMEWHPTPHPEWVEMDIENLNAAGQESHETVSRKGNRKTSQKENSLSQTGNQETSQKVTPVSGTGNLETSQNENPLSNPGNIEPARMGNLGIPCRETMPSAAYTDGKSKISGPKENIKENNKRNIYMYDITLIPPTLALRPGFKDAFNNWCIYWQQLEKPLTPLAIELDLKKLLMLSSEGYDVNQLIENAITSGWRNIYRPGSRSESPVKEVHYRSFKGIKDESY